MKNKQNKALSTCSLASLVKTNEYLCLLAVKKWLVVTRLFGLKIGKLKIYT